jgi:hypothetical protein
MTELLNYQFPWLRGERVVLYGIWLGFIDEHDWDLVDYGICAAACGATKSILCFAELHRLLTFGTDEDSE